VATHTQEGILSGARVQCGASARREYAGKGSAIHRDKFAFIIRVFTTFQCRWYPWKDASQITLWKKDMSRIIPPLLWRSRWRICLAFLVNIWEPPYKNQRHTILCAPFSVGYKKNTYVHGCGQLLGPVSQIHVHGNPKTAFNSPGGLLNKNLCLPSHYCIVQSCFALLVTPDHMINQWTFLSFYDACEQ
jgi:hypothetical protein